MKSCLIATLLLLVFSLFGTPVSLDKATVVAQNFWNHTYPQKEFTLKPVVRLEKDNVLLAYVFPQNPTGYLVVCADTDLPAVIAYSGTSDFASKDVTQENIFAKILRQDITYRLQTLPNLSEARVQERNQLWHDYQNNIFNDRTEQWPPAGSTVSEGWLESNWRQEYPFNRLCPMDPITDNRSLAGCPAIAMGQILNYHKTINDVFFTDADDYHHGYNGRNYDIDDDYAEIGFVNWPDLNGYLQTMSHQYRYGEYIPDEDKAALVWACGAAARQIYSSDLSGTFGIAYAFEAYQKFNFTNAQLIPNNDYSIFETISNNIKQAKPVHFGMSTSTLNAGHNVVLDGYNTDDYFHANFGWGGQSNGWYLLPDELPYDLTVVEGAIVDIVPTVYATFSPDSISYLTQEDIEIQKTITITNTSSIPITLESFTSQMYGNIMLAPNDDELPSIIQPGASFDFHIHTIGIIRDGLRDTLQTSASIIFDKFVFNLQVYFDPELANQDNTNIANPGTIVLSQNYPNPFNPSTTISFTCKKAESISLNIYNIKGEKICNLFTGKVEPGQKTLTWNGQDNSGKTVGSGIYFYKISNGTIEQTRKMLLIK